MSSLAADVSGNDTTVKDAVLAAPNFSMTRDVSSEFFLDS
jgi:hypothetical protein